MSGIGEFLKKDISLKRNPSAQSEAEAGTPTQEAAPKETSFLKKDVSFKRKPKAKTEAPAVQAEANAPTQEAAPKDKTSVLKKDISFKRKPKAKTEAPAVPAEATAPTQDDAPQKEKPQKQKSKRNFSMNRELSLPKRSPQRRNASARSGSRHKQVVGLSIGASQLAAAVVVNNGNPKLVKAARHNLPADVVAVGEVRDAEVLANEIAAFFDAADLPRKNVRLGIGSSRTGVRVFDRPEVDDPRQLANAIRFRAYETLPIPIEEAMLDYQIVEDPTTTDRVLLAVAYRDLVDRFAATCAAAKIELIGIDIEAFALLRAIGGEPLSAGERDEAARVAVSIGHDRTTVAVSDGRLCEFTRVLDWGGGRVTGGIERALEVDADEADRIKRALDISKEAPQDPADERMTRAVEAARREVHGLARELASSLHFYQDQPNSLGFAEITITGGGAHLKGLAEELEELIGISVRVADPFARVGSGNGFDSDGQDGSLAVAIGLGIED